MCMLGMLFLLISINILYTYINTYVCVCVTDKYYCYPNPPCFITLWAPFNGWYTTQVD